MSRRVFLHVGVMKSATSYLQDLCDVNRERLLAQGLLWAKSGDNFLATDDLLGTRRARPGLEGAWQRLAGEVEAHGGDALISNELLAPINAQRRRRLVGALAPAEASVVVTARDLARVIPSQWQTGGPHGRGGAAGGPQPQRGDVAGLHRVARRRRRQRGRGGLLATSRPAGDRRALVRAGNPRSGHGRPRAAVRRRPVAARRAIRRGGRRQRGGLRAAGGE